MSIERITIVGLLATLVFASGQLSGADFNERYAAWQGRRGTGVMPASEVQERMPTPMPAVPEIGRSTEPLSAPATTSASSQRTLSNIYSAPTHSPDYNRPWTTSQCATCSHNPGFEPASDALGTCDYVGGGVMGACGPAGCQGECPCGACGGAGGGCDWGPYCCNTLVWAKFDVLLWWRQGRDFPGIVTSDPTTESSTTAGILPDAQTIFGNERIGTNMQAGGRLDIGFFCDPRQCMGYGVRVFGMGKDDSTFNVNSTDVPVLAIPFRDFAAGANDALLVAFPGLRTGEISISGSSSLYSHDVYGRFLLCRDQTTRLDFITGWNYARVVDQVQINSRSTVTEIGGTIPVGTISNTTDQFRARNEFNGGILGLQWQRDCGVWSSNVLARMSLGNMHETIAIDGASRIAVPGQTETTGVGGIYSAASNIGSQSRNEFTAITEIGFNLAYRFAPCTQLRVGYSLLYWNDILSASTAIDTTVGTAPGGAVRPQVTFQHSDFWAQGLNLGLTREF